MIDYVAIKHGQGYALKSVAEWQALSAEQRRSLLEAREVEFISQGRCMRASVALRQIHEAAQAATGRTDAARALVND